ncbi:hypothetical protein AAFF_G00099730 [Aldrovandia affinis]|uniref:Uncharacterized protein n=1 Tax=Aldrovandia affinis TaxID=143900 RepID=A0AAD7RUV9_9TELE|nr:hypothetical protein AAFF_G00099730 [Aldrovandia affinis]
MRRDGPSGGARGRAGVAGAGAGPLRPPARSDSLSGGPRAIRGSSPGLRPPPPPSSSSAGERGSGVAPAKRLTPDSRQSHRAARPAIFHCRAGSRAGAPESRGTAHIRAI